MTGDFSGPPSQEAEPPGPGPEDERVQTRAQFRELIGQLVIEAERDPAAYRRRVLWLVARGYGYIFGVLFLILLLLAAVLGAAFLFHTANVFLFKALAPLAVVAFVILRSLWVRVQPPSGWTIGPDDAPRLMATIEDVRKKLHGPALHGVLFTGEFNAAIVQHPSLGIFGGDQSYLILGLPLLESLSPDQFRSVLAHEFGHLSGRHGRFAVWIYRLRTSWFTLMGQLEREKDRGIFSNFFREYMPRFDATTFVLARQQEYEADRMAASLTGPGTFAAALIRTGVLGRLDRKFWAGIGERAKQVPQPPQAVTTEEAEALHQGPDPSSAAAWLEEELRRPTDIDDTHPSLRDRLAALDVDPREPGWKDPIPTTAASALLGSAREELATRANREWVRLVADRWRQDHERFRAGRAEYDSLRQRAGDGSLTTGEWPRYIALSPVYEGIAPAIRLAEPFVEAHPEALRTRLLLGGMLLAAGEERGLAHIQVVAEREPALAVEECGHAYQWLFERSRQGEADDWARRVAHCGRTRERGFRERCSLGPTDTFLPHDLGEEITAVIRERLDGIPGIRAAWLARKQLEVLPDEPSWVLALAPSLSWLAAGRGGRARKLAQRLEARLPRLEHTLVMILGPELDCLCPVLEAVPGSRIR